jgi:hypothetical protein
MTHQESGLFDPPYLSAGMPVAEFGPQVRQALRVVPVALLTGSILIPCGLV